MYVDNGHRCSRCLTKYYCGKACLDEDWIIHKEACVKVERKKIMDKKERLHDSNMYNSYLYNCTVADS